MNEQNTQNTIQKQSFKPRFGVIDLMIVLAILAVGVSVVLRYDIAGKIGIKSNRDTVIISFLVQDIKETSADAFVVGDTFYWKINDMKIGELMDKRAYPAEAFVENAAGALIKTYNERTFDVRGEIKAQGLLTDDGFMLSGIQYLGPGKILQVQSKNIIVSLQITNIIKA